MEPQNTGDTMEAAAPVDTVQNEPHGGESRSVPLDALQSERAQRQALQEELRVIKDHLALMQRQPQQQQKDELDSLSDDDVLTVGEAKKFLSKMTKQTDMTLAELKMVQKHPDYEEVITKYLPEVLKQNPGLQRSLQASQDYELAYYLAKNSEVYKSESKKQKKHADAERILQNSASAGALSSVGSNAPIGDAKRYKEMSDSEFMQTVQKNLGYY